MKRRGFLGSIIGGAAAAPLLAKAANGRHRDDSPSDFGIDAAGDWNRELILEGRRLRESSMAKAEGGHRMDRCRNVMIQDGQVSWYDCEDGVYIPVW